MDENQKQPKIKVTFNEKVATFDHRTTPYDIAYSFNPRLASRAYIAKVDQEFWDLSRPLTHDCTLQIIPRSAQEAISVLRHDCAHVLAQAVQELYPGTKIAFGPAIEDGFYYDFQIDHAFTPEDLSRIETVMQRVVDEDHAFTREVWSHEEAVHFFQEQQEVLKAEHVEDLGLDSEITIYRQGEWLDLCRGPHGPSTKHIGHAFTLTKVAGAYWKGRREGPLLQRIYGTCWWTDGDLKAYQRRIHEAEARDHRKLGKRLELFHIQEEAAGSIFWHPRGWRLFRKIQEYIRRRTEESQYHEVNTPQLVDKTLWEQSGHWEKFRDNMYVIPVDEQKKEDATTKENIAEKQFALKPMNCPGHVQIFRQKLVSYRNLPLRFSEFGSCVRNEPSGALHGLMRVRAFTQDDGHIFCEETQIEEETIRFCEQLARIYRDMGFETFHIKFATRPPVRAGSDAVWDRAEEALSRATQATGYSYTMNPGEGAFYGPKLEFVLRDALGRDWQCGTLQVDFVLPERLGATYIDREGNKRNPTMLHRAVLGSFERFIGILIEHYGGKLPLWLAPSPLVLATITDDSLPYAQELHARLHALDIKADLDQRNETIGYKIRQHVENKIPIIWVIGKQEQENRSVNIRRLGQKKSETMPIEQAIASVVEEAKPPDQRS